MTLVEVLASLSLLGALLGAAVVAQARLSHQWQTAENRVSALAALDAQIEAWRSESADLQNSSEVAGNPPNVVQPSAEVDVISAAQDESTAHQNPPLSGEGPLSTAPWWWRAETIEEQPGKDFGIYLIRYTAFDPASPERSPVAAIEIFRYVPTPPEPSDEPLPSESASSTQEPRTNTPPRSNNMRSSSNPGANE